MANEIKIKTPIGSDFVQISKLYKDLYRGDEEQKFFKSGIDPSNFKCGNRIFVAKENHKVIGFIWVIWYEHIKNKGVGIIEELYIDENYRRKGLGKMLVNKALQYLKKHTIVVVVTTGVEMKTAQKFYKALNFKPSREWYYYDFRVS